MSFIATEDLTSADTGPIIIENDGWFPNIDLSLMRDAMRLDGTVTDPRLKQAVIAAIIHVNSELSVWQKTQQLNSIATLADVPSSTVNKESVLIAKYQRAIYSTAKADLIERYRDYDTTGEGNKKAEWLDNSPDEQRRNAHWAVADILQRTHTTVELI